MKSRVFNQTRPFYSCFFGRLTRFLSMRSVGFGLSCSVFAMIQFARVCEGCLKLSNTLKGGSKDGFPGVIYGV